MAEERHKERRQGNRELAEFVSQFKQSKAGMLGLALIVIFILLSVYVVIAYPYQEVVKWNDVREWSNNPPTAPPFWAKVFSGRDLPETQVLNGSVARRYNVEGIYFEDRVLDLSYTYDEAPSEIIVNLDVTFQGGAPLIEVSWTKPSGATITVLREAAERSTGGPPYNFNHRLYVFIDQEVKTNMVDYLLSRYGVYVPTGSVSVANILFGKDSPSLANASSIDIEKGIYQLKIHLQAYDVKDAITGFSAVVKGKVWGWMGTDIWGRDLLIGILWGTPVALLIGALTSVLSVGIGMVVGIVSGFYEGRIGEVLERITDFFYMLPVLPLLIFVSFILRPSIWVMIPLLSLFGWPGIAKTARSIALQVKQETYVEAARALGASNSWILIHHIAPQTLPFSFANIALSVPGYIFTEASISFLGLGDPVLPTWGKILGDAQASGATIGGYWWWVLIPGVMIFLVAISFALLGNALDRIVAPRLRRRE